MTMKSLLRSASVAHSKCARAVAGALVLSAVSGARSSVNAQTLQAYYADPCFGSYVSTYTVPFTVSNGFTCTNVSGLTFIVSNSARASFTQLGAAISLQVINSASSTIGGPGATVLVQVLDVLTITGGTGVGTFRVVQSVDGTFSSSGSASNAPGYLTSFFTETYTSGSPYATDYVFNGDPGNFSGSMVAVMDFQFQYGVPINFARRLSVNAGAFFSGPPGFSATTDFFNTAAFQYEVLDQNFDPVTGAMITGDGGFVYPTSGNSVVPEPASLTLLATGLAGVFVAGARRRRKVAAA